MKLLNMLFDCRIAMELYYLKLIEFVFPVLIGTKIMNNNSNNNNNRTSNLLQTDNTELIDYFAAYRGEVIGKFGGSHPNIPTDLIIPSLENLLMTQFDILKLGIPVYHEGLNAVTIIRHVVTDFEDYIVKGNVANCLETIGNQMYNILQPIAADEAEVGAGGVTRSTRASSSSSIMGSPMGKQPDNNGPAPITVDVDPETIQSPGPGTNSGLASGSKSPMKRGIPSTNTRPNVDINMLSDAERVTYVTKLLEEITSKQSAIELLEAELISHQTSLQMKSSEIITLRKECNLPIPFIDHRSPQKHWN